MTNRDAARSIFAAASLLESQGANPYRIRAYRRAALRMLVMKSDVTELTNADGELELPWLGKRLRRKLGELVISGHMQFYDDMVAELPAPLRELLSVPGIGPKTAMLLIEQAGVKSVRGLMRAAHRGQLRQLRGIGEVRERQLREAAEKMIASAAA